MRIKVNRWRIFIIAAFTIIALFWTSCLRHYNLADRDVQTRLFKQIKLPLFKKYTLQNHTIHYAHINPCDTLPLILFIHGAPGAWYGYINFLDDSILQSKYQMISVDRLGYGDSDPGVAVTSIEEQAQFLQPIIDQHCNEKPILIIGRSFGAPVAVKLAADNQDKVKRLFLLGADLDPDKEKFWWFSPFGKLSLFRWILPQSMNVATDEKYSRANELRKLVHVWPKIQIPVTVMHGGNDWIVDTSNLNFAKRMLINSPASKFILLPETGHLVSSERPEVVKREIFNVY